MPAAKTKTASTNGAAGKGKLAKPASSPTGSGAATPTSTPKVDEQLDAAVAATRAGRPDKAAYDAEQEGIKKEIEGMQAKLSAIQDKINSASSTGASNDRRLELRSEWDKIRQEQGQFKNSRGKIMEQLKSLNETVQKKIKDLNAAKAKTPYRTIAEVDARIQQLDKQVESGSMKLADEKRALQEISQCKRSRRNVEAFEADQEAIERDRAAADELRRQLDDPEMKAVSDRADAIKAELDQIKKENDEAYDNRNKLFDERNERKAELDSLYSKKRESAQRYREDNDRYWAKVNEDRARRAERARAQRAAEEDAKKLEISSRLREEAEAPAFQAQIEDCQTLIDYFSGKSSGAAASATAAPALSARAEVAGVPKLELRQVDNAPAEGLVVRKKKGEDEQPYFMGKGKGKGKKGAAAKANGTGTGAADAASAPSPTSTTGTPTAAAPANTQLNVPLATLSALLSLSIPPPSSTGDVPRTIEDLKTKKSWFEANQARVTAENVAKAEADIKRLLNGGKAAASSGAAAATISEIPPNGGGERPAEPASTPASTDKISTSVPAEEIDEKLESVQEAEEVGAAAEAEEADAEAIEA